MEYRKVLSIGALSATLIVAGACNREATPNAARDEAAEAAARAADLREERADTVAALNERIAKLERDYVDEEQKVARGTRTATEGLRSELKEDVANVKKAVADLGSTTAENWWDRHEEAIKHTTDDIEADVRRLAGGIPAVHSDRTTGTTGVASSAPFTSRRDAFVDDMRARVKAMGDALDKTKARGARETEVEDTRARLKKLDDDLDRLRSAEADDWWDVSKARVTEYVDRVADSVGRLDDNKP
jgi:hypothetical protein